MQAVAAQPPTAPARSFVSAIINLNRILWLCFVTSTSDQNDSNDLGCNMQCINFKPALYLDRPLVAPLVLIGPCIHHFGFVDRRAAKVVLNWDQDIDNKQAYFYINICVLCCECNKKSKEDTWRRVLVSFSSRLLTRSKTWSTAAFCENLSKMITAVHPRKYLAQLTLLRSKQILHFLDLDTRAICIKILKMIPGTP